MPPVSRRQDPAKLMRVAATQAGVVGRRQLAACGYDADAIRRRVEARIWQTSGRAVVLHSGAPTPRQLQWAAILTVSGLAVLTGRTACAIYGLRGFPADQVDVVVPACAKPVEMPGVRWHRSRRLVGADAAVNRRPPIVSAARAVIDAAAWTRSPKIACALMVAAAQQRVVPVRLLRGELAAVGQVRHRGVLLAILADIEGGADSLAEIDFVKLARRAGLPPPRRQSIRVDAAGRRRFLDVDFGCFSVEIDGGFHIRPLNYWDDARRQNDLLLTGKRILRFPSVAIRVEPQIVMEQLRAAYRLFGQAVVSVAGRPRPRRHNSRPTSRRSRPAVPATRRSRRTRACRWARSPGGPSRRRA